MGVKSDGETNCIEWDFKLLKRIAEAAGKSPNALRYTIVKLAKDLGIKLPRSHIKSRAKNLYRTELNRNE